MPHACLWLFYLSSRDGVVCLRFMYFVNNITAFLPLVLQAADLANITSDDTLNLECVVGKGSWGTVYKGKTCCAL